VIAATNPGPAFPADAVTSAPQSGVADWALSTRLGAAALRGVLAGTRVASGVFPKLPPAFLAAASRRFPDLVNMGALTIPANLYGNPAVSIPAGTIDGLPVGIQVLARHHADALLLDLALAAERHRPWPLVAPAVTGALTPA
jgi:aspartyl-tRNA(Asn)/glutamyl-tRNA(Gln) amidotransferase subunit A